MRRMPVGWSRRPWQKCRQPEAASVAPRSPMPSSPIANVSRRPRAANWGSSLTSTSCSRIAQELLARCLAGAPPDELLRALLEEPCGQALFGIWVEGLADRFEQALCDVYARLFAQAAAHVDPALNAEVL